jgi:hypothetical protein
MHILQKDLANQMSKAIKGYSYKEKDKQGFGKTKCQGKGTSFPKRSFYKGAHENDYYT